MADAAWAASGPDDAALLNTVRTGDDAAFEVLYKRHVRAVSVLARDLVDSPAEADHLVAETFALVLDVTKRRGGPTDAFRPYTLTALRRVAASQVRGSGSAARADKEIPDPGEPFIDATVATIDGSLLARAFLSLPERWQAVLWHLQIEQARPADVAPLFALPADAVDALGQRAADGLRQAYLRLHLPRVTRPDCKPVAERIGDHLRNTLSRRNASMVAEHLATCAECAAICAELADLGAALRSQVAPVILGGAAASYLSGIAATPAGAGPPTAPLPGVISPDALPVSAEPPPATTPALAALARSFETSGQRWVAVGVGAALLAVGAAFAIALTMHRTPADPPGHRGLAATSSLGVGTTAGQPSAPASDKATPSPAHRSSPKASATPAPDVTTAPSPAAAAQLAAGVSVVAHQGRGGNWAQVSFTVTDTGNAATGQITAAITLPAGSWFPGNGHHFGGGGGFGGWSCQADSGGASCQHSALSAGAQAEGVIFIVVGGSACGQPVQLTATSGTSSASAGSGDIQCNSGR